MLCEICGKRPGDIKLVIRDHVKKTVCVCRECEARSLAEERARLARAKRPVSVRPPDTPKLHLTCPHCGTTTEEFEETKLFGCEYCYETFEPILAEIVPRCQPSAVHVGKAPAYTRAARGSEYEYLRGQLNRAVKEERYSDAAAFKKLLDGLKGGR